MQNVKGVMFKKFLSIVAFVTCLFCVASVCMAGADVPPQVFIGNTPTAIIVQRGMPVEVPIFFVGGTCTDKEVELFVFRVEEQGLFVCFGPEGWENDYAMALEDFKTFCNVPSLPEYIYLSWEAFEDTQSLSDFDLWVCVDDQVDGTPTENSVYCGHQSIIIKDDDGGTEDDDDSGTEDDDDSGYQLPTVPSFPGFGDDSCQSLKYTPEGTTVSYDSIGRSLELGASEQITLITTACGNPVTVSSVTKTLGGAWLSASSGGGSKVILNLDAGASDVEVGSNSEGYVKVVTTGGITDIMRVTLQVQGQCDPTSASVTPSSLSFHAYVGQNPSAQTIRVKDNCGHAVSATASSNRNWLTVTGTGVFSVSCNTSGMSIGSYSGTISLTDNEYGQQHSVPVTLEVTNTDDSVTTVYSGHTNYYDVGPGQTRYFKFVAGVPDCQHRIQVNNAPQPNQPRTVHVLVKRGGKPTIAEFERTWEMAPSKYNCSLEQWRPAKPGAENLYWNYNTGSQAEYVEIGEPMASNTFYIMLYNNGTSTVRNQRLIVSY